MAELDAISETIHSENEGNPIMDFLKKVFSVTPTAPVAKKEEVKAKVEDKKEEAKAKAEDKKAPAAKAKADAKPKDKKA